MIDLGRQDSEASPFFVVRFSCSDGCGLGSAVSEAGVFGVLMILPCARSDRVAMEHEPPPPPSSAESKRGEKCVDTVAASSQRVFFKWGSPQVSNRFAFGTLKCFGLRSLLRHL